ncbi:MAG: FAD-dependent oxidoreductase [Oscillospiraceae bacterium]|nr:FAD-dependent oxidoreductase [Oscillospiraceae bacterium]
MAFKYPHLFEPITLAGRLYRNRIFASPTGYQNMTCDNILPPGAAAYYERKAMGGAASVATCELIVDSRLGRGGVNQTCIDDPRAANPLCRIANAVTTHGAVAAAELQHAGMYANRDLSFFGAASRGEAYAPVERELDGVLIPEMPETVIEQIIEKFAHAAAEAKRFGFGAILIHAGHGWLLHQFLSPLNTRKDRWGGPDIENRARLTLAVCEAVRKAVGPRFPIEVRISGAEGFEGGFGLDTSVALAKMLDGKCDLIHVSAGNHEVEEAFPVSHPGMFLDEGCNVVYAAEIKKHVSSPVATVGALGDPEMLEEIIASGKADVVEMARALLADPDLPIKLRSGRENEINKCLRCLNCFSSELTWGEPYCSINPETGRELEMKYGESPSRRRRVLVVGGGIGGMRAALTCAQRGHEVVLCEKSDRLGGAIRCEKDVPFKKDLELYITRQEQALRQSGAEIRLNTEVTGETAEQIKPDVIIAALGARPVKPPVEGIDRDNVLGAAEAYAHPEKTGRKTVIIGAGLVGLELAVYLAMKGREICVLEMERAINDGGNFLHAIGLRLELKKRNVRIMLSTVAEKISDGEILCRGPEGGFSLEADTVIYAAGQKPLREESLALNYCAPEFYMIGDCVEPRNMASANAEAFTIARDIGRS